MTEPWLAHHLARALPRGHGLFLGNSMPIRDMDMFGYGSRVGGNVGNGGDTWGADALGARVAANRGASGIDGVLSAAAGFAAGLDVPVTLLVGDVSFVHDTNALSMLRTCEDVQPLTIVVVNNNGGGIFSFLPVKSMVGDAEFSRIWGTPHHTDIGSLCRAHGVAHARARSPDEVVAALEAAWKLRQHNVVEVFTDGEANVAVHREVQAVVAAAVYAARVEAPLRRVPSTSSGL